MTAPLHPAVRGRLHAVLRDHFALSASHLLAADTTINGSFADGGLEGDSLDTVELTVLLEEEFEIEIPDDAAADAGTIGEIENWLADNLRHCRTCGCTENRACVGRGNPCGWAGPQICTTCLPDGGA